MSKKKQSPRMFLIFKFLEIWFREMANMMASCAEVGMVATLKAEYMHNAQLDSGQSDGCVVGQTPAEAGSSSPESPLVVQSANFEI